MFRVAVPAHNLSEIEHTIGADFGVTIVDRTDEPWDVVFEGTKQGLTSMLTVNWWSGDHEDREFKEMLDSIYEVKS